MFPFGSQGGLKKLEIRAYKDDKCNQEIKELSMQLMLNPDSFASDYTIELANTQAPNNTGANNSYVRIVPEKTSLEFLFDRTGAIPDGPPAQNGVFDDIEKLKKVLVGYNPDTHSINYLKVIWGRLILYCKLTDLKITYKLFKPDGTPLRATATCSFEQFKDVELRVAEENQKSPDVTHSRIVPDGDHLPYMTHLIYGDSKYYLEIARANGLVNFRRMRAGSTLFFPPIEK